MNVFDPAAIVAARLPVLCIDTCSVLDIMRDPTRDDANKHHHEAAIALLERAEKGDLACIVAKQVQHEFADHDAQVQDEASRMIAKLREKLDRVNEIHGTFLPSVSMDHSHLGKLVAASRTIVRRLLAASMGFDPSPAVLPSAWERVNRNISPSAKGKDSIKDCVVFETYLEAMTALRAAGLSSNAVFLSSNWREYLGEGKVLKPDLVSDFGRVNMNYANNISLAKVRLGF